MFGQMPYVSIGFSPGKKQNLSVQPLAQPAAASRDTAPKPSDAIAHLHFAGWWIGIVIALVVLRILYEVAD